MLSGVHCIFVRIVRKLNAFEMNFRNDYTVCRYAEVQTKWRNGNGVHAFALLHLIVVVQIEEMNIERKTLGHNFVFF